MRGEIGFRSPIAIGAEYDWSDEHSDEDVRKITHYAVWHLDLGRRRRVILDYTPYQFMTPDVFDLFVLTGFPDRLYCALRGVSSGLAPVTREDLIALCEANRSVYDAIRPK